MIQSLLRIYVTILICSILAKHFITRLIRIILKFRLRSQVLKWVLKTKILSFEMYGNMTPLTRQAKVNINGVNMRRQKFASQISAEEM